MEKEILDDQSFGVFSWPFNRNFWEVAKVFFHIMERNFFFLFKIGHFGCFVFVFSFSFEIFFVYDS